ncbi:META domain-containing protein [Mangrovivirga sp. M17]|uniref:META domain-containing protein n=1 Tax=Mangrovivirga halotolerans TaxID=2993936 RepID=A0ABT3RQN6_9BACT|nr:META domain-containing protein [Mangrovivirga halotolerans]MCX2743925.1 META domain-containing protein [Mangrovivirga halotolerans]
MKYHLLICSVLISLLNYSCKTNESFTKGDKLLDNSWKLTEIHFESTGIPDSKRKIPTLRFDKHGSVVGKTGCNIISGKYFVKDNYLLIQLRPFRKKGCSKLENDLILSLTQTSSYIIHDNELILKDSDKYLLTFSSKNDR